ncbi:Gfo/Idh/MocA family oxidoreductase [Actinoallomurus sp. NBC_01490]|uniref:Gfo/Idh/MocA family protein n=1 Tax=Actinoallomurus sp. NBC_01490 TaxID=2903557 RepID=UPI002E33B1D8|nr:Gfo/Idh/MocA family oxidoreductase [Actinoallomurus sp. NBC_01490]
MPERLPPPAGPPSAGPVPGTPVRVLLAGVYGHGRTHVRNLGRLVRAGAVTVAGVCDPRPVSADTLAGLGDPPWSGDLTDLLVRTRPDVTVICTPIHTHADLAVAAMEAGSHVLLEKPPAPGRAEYDRIARTAERTGRACQVGFQDLASSALPAIARLVDDGVIGEPLGISGACAWVRPAHYFTRSPWAGRRAIGGRPVVDGALTNPFAHAVASALRLARATAPADLARIEVELYRANAIESDDTSCVRVHTRHGTPVTVAATLCAAADHDPRLVVHGTRGRVTLFYKRGEVRLEAGGARETALYPRTDLLENLIAHVARPDAVELLVPLRATGAFTAVVEAVRTAPDPAEIGEPHRVRLADEHGDRFVVSGIDDLVTASAADLALYSELHAPWAVAPTTYGGTPPAATTAVREAG